MLWPRRITCGSSRLLECSGARTRGRIGADSVMSCLGRGGPATGYHTKRANGIKIRPVVLGQAAGCCHPVDSKQAAQSPPHATIIARQASSRSQPRKQQKTKQPHR